MNLGHRNKNGKQSRDQRKVCPFMSHMKHNHQNNAESTTTETRRDSLSRFFVKREPMLSAILDTVDTYKSQLISDRYAK